MLAMGVPELPEEAFGGIGGHRLNPIARGIGARQPTLHGGGGGGLKAVVGVVAAVAIPFVAPAIAGAIATSAGISAATFGLSATVGATLGSAIVGAGLGAVTAAATGGNVGRGALFGGIGGGIGGYIDATSAAAQASGTGLKVPTTTAAPTPTGTEGLTSTTGVGGYGTYTPPDYSLAGGTGQSFGTLRAPASMGTDLGSTLSGTQAGGTGITLSGTGTSSYGGLNPNAAGGVGLNPNAAGGVGIRLPGTETAGAGTSGFGSGVGSTGTGGYASTSWTPPDYSLAGAQATSTGTGTGIGLRMPTTPGTEFVGLRAPTNTANIFGSGFGGSTGGTATAASGAWDKFSDALKTKFTDPKQQADMVLRAAGQIAGSAFAGDGLSDEEKQLLAQQRAELEQLRVTNQDLFNQRLQAAMELKGEAGYFNPEFFGSQSLKAYQTAAGRAERDVLRGIAPQRSGLRTAEERRFALARSSGGQTAYLQGADVAQQNRLRTSQAAAGLIPTGGPTAALSYGNYIGQIYDAAERRRRQAAGDIGDLFGTFTGTPMANKA